MKIAFIGGGNMASALVGGLLAKGQDPRELRTVEIDPNARQRLEKLGILVFSQVERTAIEGSEIVVLAVKPQQVREVCVQVRPLLGDQVVLSIAAGVRLTDLARWLGTNTSVVRAMPNTPALIGEGIAGLCSFPPKKMLKPHHVKLVEEVMGAVGQFVWVDDNDQMDVVTAVSGSGPAYVFWLIEQLEGSGAALGLKPETARKLAIQTVLGAARLAAQGTEPPGTLRERVTSKGGTTEAALDTFRKEQLAERFRKAIEAARRRGAELGELLGRD